MKRQDFTYRVFAYLLPRGLPFQPVSVHARDAITARRVPRIGFFTSASVAQETHSRIFQTFHPLMIEYLFRNQTLGARHERIVTRAPAMNAPISFFPSLEAFCRPRPRIFPTHRAMQREVVSLSPASGAKPQRLESFVPHSTQL